MRKNSILITLITLVGLLVYLFWGYGWTVILEPFFSIYEFFLIIFQVPDRLDTFFANPSLTTLLGTEMLLNLLVFIPITIQMYRKRDSLLSYGSRAGFFVGLSIVNTILLLGTVFLNILFNGGFGVLYTFIPLTLLLILVPFSFILGVSIYRNYSTKKLVCYNIVYVLLLSFLYLYHMTGAIVNLF